MAPTLVAKGSYVVKLWTHATAGYIVSETHNLQGFRQLIYLMHNYLNPSDPDKDKYKDEDDDTLRYVLKTDVDFAVTAYSNANALLRAALPSLSAGKIIVIQSYIETKADSQAMQRAICSGSTIKVYILSPAIPAEASGQSRHKKNPPAFSGTI